MHHGPAGQNNYLGGGFPQSTSEEPEQSKAEAKQKRFSRHSKGHRRWHGFDFSSSYYQYHSFFFFLSLFFFMEE